MNNKLQKTKQESIFSNIEAFENGQRIAQALSKADLVPQQYKGNIPNTMIALEMANRMGVSPFMVMQNLDIIKGKPSWSSSFIISALNSCGRFKPLRFKFEGQKGTDNYGCRAVTIDLETNEEVIGVLVDWNMVKAEGWLNKSGSKWKTMPELMFHYRSASFFGRLYAPDILSGMHSIEENIDISSIKNTIQDQLLEEIKDLLDNPNIDIPEDERLNIERILENKETLSYDKAINYLTSQIPSIDE